MRHDYKAALDEFENGDGFTCVETNEAILHALRLAQKVSDASIEMDKIGAEILNKYVPHKRARVSYYDTVCIAEDVFTAMIAQAEKEIENDR